MAGAEISALHDQSDFARRMPRGFQKREERSRQNQKLLSVKAIEQRRRFIFSDFKRMQNANDGHRIISLQNNSFVYRVNVTVRQPNANNRLSQKRPFSELIKIDREYCE